MRERDGLDRIIEETAAALAWPEQRAEGYRSARAAGVALLAIVVVAVVLLVGTALTAGATERPDLQEISWTTTPCPTTDPTSTPCATRSAAHVLSSSPRSAALTVSRSERRTPSSSEPSAPSGPLEQQLVAEVLTVDTLAETGPGAGFWLGVYYVVGLLGVGAAMWHAAARKKRGER